MTAFLVLTGIISVIAVLWYLFPAPEQVWLDWNRIGKDKEPDLFN